MSNTKTYIIYAVILILYVTASVYRTTSDLSALTYDEQFNKSSYLVNNYILGLFPLFGMLLVMLNTINVLDKFVPLTVLGLFTIIGLYAHKVINTNTIISTSNPEFLITNKSKLNAALISQGMIGSMSIILIMYALVGKLRKKKTV